MPEGLVFEPVSTPASAAVHPKIAQLNHAPERDGFSSIAALPSNLKAIEASLLFCSGVQGCVAIVGPSGWGKSHLLSAAAKVIRRSQSTTVAVLPAIDWASGNCKWDINAPVILDDVQDALNQVRTRQNLRIGLERRVKSGRPTLVAHTDEHPNKGHRSVLPCIREWIVGGIEEPTSAERELVARQIASTKGMAVDGAILTLLAKKTKGNGRSLDGALERLKLVQDRWMGSEAVLKACGILGPYFGDCHGWDVRDHIHETVSSVYGKRGLSMAQLTSAVKLSIYIMLADVGIGEEEVASYFRLSPGETYACAQQLASSLAVGPTKELHLACLEALHSSIEQL